jgi:predicted XRE-type DNA-binding protein
MKITAKFENVRRTEPAPTPAPRSGSAARNLALAHKLNDLIERGLVADQTAAAKLLGVSQPRLTHLLSLTMLAPTLQEAILAGTIAPGDKALRQLARIAEWREQIAALPNLGTPKSEGNAPDVPAAGLPHSLPPRNTGDQP